MLLLYFLQEGITVKFLKIGNYQVQGLYLKLDNKLTLKIKKLTIPQRGSSTEWGDIDKRLSDLKKVLAYFDAIALDSVLYTDDEYRVYYADDTIYLDSRAYEVAGMVTPQKGGLVAELSLLYLKKQNLTLNGTLTYGYAQKRFGFRGRYKIETLEGNVTLQGDKREVAFLLDSGETGQISTILDHFPIPSKVRVWLDGRVTARQYRLERLRGEIAITSQGFHPDIATLRAEALLKDVAVVFHPKLPPVQAKSVRVRLHDDRLDFEMEAPRYSGIGIDGSQAALLHLSQKGKKELLLKIKLHHRYDEKIAKLLSVYRIKLPLTQQKGKVKAVVDLDIDLKKKHTKVEGRALLSAGELTLAGTPLKLHGGEVTFTSKRAALWNVDIYDSWYRGVVNGYLNFSTKRGKFDLALKKLFLGDPKGVSLSVKNRQKLEVKMQYHDGVGFEIPAYGLKISAGKQKALRIVQSDLRTLLPFVKGLPLRLNGGNLTVSLYTKDHYDFSGTAEWKKSYIYHKNGYITSIPFQGSYKKGTLKLSALKGRFSYLSGKDLMVIKDINIDAKRMMQRYEGKGGKGLKKLRVKGRNSMIRYDKYVLLTDRFDLSVSGKNTTFIAVKDGDRVRIEKNGNSIVAHAEKIKDTMLRALIHFNGLQGGRYSLELLGDIDGEMKGEIRIKGGAIKSFKAYNDLIALFNTIPALMTLSDPGFSSKGFVVRDGKILFRIVPGRVIFDTIYLNGKSSTIAGKGTVDLDSGKLNIDLAIRTAREMGKVLGNLPVVGYILFGKDKSITTGVKIKGTLDHPKVKTNPVQDALLYPLELLKRTVTSPAHIINQ